MHKLALVALLACGHDASPPPAPVPAPVPVAVRAPGPDARAPDAAAVVDEDIWHHAMHHHDFDHAALAKQLGSHMGEQVTLVAFWASWCKPCRMEIPQLDKLAASEHDKRLSIVAVNLDTDRGAAQHFIADHHLTLPVVFDPEAAIYETVFLGSHDMLLPAAAIVWRDGVEIEDGYEEMTDDQYVAIMRYRLAPHLH